MEKHLLLIASLLCAALSSGAQIASPPCKPDPKLPEGAIGIFPNQLAYSISHTGTVRSDTACLNVYFEQVFTVKMPKPALFAAFPGVNPLLLSLSIDSTALNIPKGMGIACDPPSCVFPLGSTGCVAVRGVPTYSLETGPRQISIQGIFSMGGIRMTVPDSGWYAGGTFSLHILPEGSPACKPSNTSELAATKLLMRNTPNPFQDITTIEVNSGFRGRFEFRVSDFTGRVMHREAVQIYVGDNRIPFDGGALPNGIYIYTLSDGVHSVSRKMVLHR
ncbi:MAG: hypothetical protein RL181_215 [Bacteroidota bacterium]